MNDSSSMLSCVGWHGISSLATSSKVSLCVLVILAGDDAQAALLALSYFNWVCWIAPNNIVVNQLFGYTSGLGMSLITFDWAQIAYIGSPLVR